MICLLQRKWKIVELALFIIVPHIWWEEQREAKPVNVDKHVSHVLKCLVGSMDTTIL